MTPKLAHLVLSLVVFLSPLAGREGFRKLVDGHKQGQAAPGK